MDHHKQEIETKYFNKLDNKLLKAKNHNRIVYIQEQWIQEHAVFKVANSNGSTRYMKILLR